jgi:hypothetical protein
MFTVTDLDKRDRTIRTHSRKLAQEYWSAIVESGGTPVATFKNLGAEARWSPAPA